MTNFDNLRKIESKAEELDLPELMEVIVLDDPWPVFDEDGEIVVDW